MSKAVVIVVYLEFFGVKSRRGRASVDLDLQRAG
jgi:hypothetical protein